MNWEYVMLYDGIFRNIGDEDHHDMEDNSVNNP